jgi:ABC-type multidrug transport system ATPase subunit
VGLAQACLKHAHLLLLDELTASLDVETSRRVYRFIRSRLQPGQYVVFSTHIADDVTRLADALVIIKDGQITFDGTPSELIEQAAGHVYRACVPRDELPQWTQRYTVTQTQETDDNTLFLRIVSLDSVQKASPITPSLEDAYIYFQQITASR